MKTIFAITITALFWNSACAVPITKEQHDTMKTFNVQDLNLNAGDLVGKIIVIRFTHRHQISDDSKSGMHRVSVGYHMPTTDFAHITVLFPDEGRKFFEAVSGFKSMPRWYTAYAQVENDAHGKPSVKVIGINMKLTTSGGGEITW